MKEGARAFVWILAALAFGDRWAITRRLGGRCPLVITIADSPWVTIVLGQPVKVTVQLETLRWMRVEGIQLTREQAASIVRQLSGQEIGETE